MLFVAASAALFLAGCAKHPDDIPAARVDALPFQMMNCEQLKDKLSTTDHALADEISTQKTLHVIDMALPIVAGTGSRETQVANLRGERLTISETLAAKRCL